jgi:hypothetical protein
MLELIKKAYGDKEWEAIVKMAATLSIWVAAFGAVVWIWRNF